VADFGAIPAGGAAAVAVVVIQPDLVGYVSRVANVRFETDPSNNEAIRIINAVPATRLANAFLIPAGRSIGGVTLAFDADLDPASASNPANYRLASAGHDGRPGTADDVPLVIAQASYDPASRAVTLLLDDPLPPLGSFVRVAAGGPGTPGLLDAHGNPITGDLDSPGAAATFSAGLGPSLSYTEPDTDRVELRLARGGVLQVILAPDGIARNLALIGPTRGRSILSGTVRRGPLGNGLAVIASITGLGGLTSSGIRITDPPFLTGGILPPPRRPRGR
jgi:hypothetical protein